MCLVSGLPEDFNLLNPGLESYYALKHADTNKVAKFYGGHVFDPVTIESLRLQPDLYPHTLLYRGFTKTNQLTSSLTSQYDDFFNTLHVRGGEAFS